MERLEKCHSTQHGRLTFSDPAQLLSNTLSCSLLDLPQLLVCLLPPHPFRPGTFLSPSITRKTHALGGCVFKQLSPN